MLVICSIVSFSYWFDVPANDEWVTDAWDIFSDQEEIYLEAQLQALEEVHKAEVAVLTVASLAGEDITQVAYQVATDRWIGKDEADNGILILIAPNERERRIEVWYGLEWAVPDITAFQLGRQDLVPAFREQKYFQWVTTLIEHLSWVVAGEYTPDMQANAWSDASLAESFFMWLFVLSFLWFFISTFARSAIDAAKKWVSESKKKNIFQLWSLINMLPWLIIVWIWWLVYIIPLYYIWKWMITSDQVTMMSSSTWWFNGWYWWWGSSFWWGFSGFGWGSFWWGGASGGW